MKKTLLSILLLGCVLCSKAQPAGGFGGYQMPQVKLETSQQWKDVNYAGDDQAYHTCDIYLPKQEKESYPVVIHIYGCAWFSNNSKGAADLGTIVKALLDAGYAVVFLTTVRALMRSGLHRSMTSVPSSALCVVRLQSISSTQHLLPPPVSLQVVISLQPPPLPVG